MLDRAVSTTVPVWGSSKISLARPSSSGTKRREVQLGPPAALEPVAGDQRLARAEVGGLVGGRGVVGEADRDPQGEPGQHRAHDQQDVAARHPRPPGGRVHRRGRLDGRFGRWPVHTRRRRRSRRSITGSGRRPRARRRPSSTGTARRTATTSKCAPTSAAKPRCRPVLDVARRVAERADVLAAGHVGDPPDRLAGHRDARGRRGTGGRARAARPAGRARARAPRWRARGRTTGRGTAGGRCRRTRRRGPGSRQSPASSASGRSMPTTRASG